MVPFWACLTILAGRRSLTRTRSRWSCQGKRKRTTSHRSIVSRNPSQLWAKRRSQRWTEPKIPTPFPTSTAQGARRTNNSPKWGPFPAVSTKSGRKAAPATWTQTRSQSSTKEQWLQAPVSLSTRTPECSSFTHHASSLKSIRGSSTGCPL